jgi:hypothetical protein
LSTHFFFALGLASIKSSAMKRSATVGKLLLLAALLFCGCKPRAQTQAVPIGTYRDSTRNESVIVTGDAITFFVRPEHSNSVSVRTYSSHSVEPDGRIVPSPMRNTDTEVRKLKWLWDGTNIVCVEQDRQVVFRRSIE